jgi:integrase/recombinase XerD
MANRSIQQYVPQTGFEAACFEACFAISASINTRKAYWTDVRRWLQFASERGVDPSAPAPLVVIAWIEAMRTNGIASKTRARRMAALSSVFDYLRRRRLVEMNAFSVDIGPEREVAITEKPTPIISPDAVRRILETCGDNLQGIRDAAIIRVLWGTGARRSSLVGMTFARLQREANSLIAMLVGKGGKEIRILIRGNAADALLRWLAELSRGGITTGSIWRHETGSDVTEKDVWRMLRRRAKAAGVTEPITPHTFRVAFLTYNPAGLEAKQDAAGHADPATTRLYDRSAWRGREAFEAMPEVEDL